MTETISSTVTAAVYLSDANTENPLSITSTGAVYAAAGVADDVGRAERAGPPRPVALVHRHGVPGAGAAGQRCGDRAAGPRRDAPVDLA